MGMILLSRIPEVNLNSREENGQCGLTKTTIGRPGSGSHSADSHVLSGDAAGQLAVTVWG